MKKTILAISLAHLLFTTPVSADQSIYRESSKESREPHVQMLPLMQREQLQNRFIPPAYDRPPVIIKLLQRRRTEERIRTYHT